MSGPRALYPKPELSEGGPAACLAELPNPLRAEAARPEGQAGIIKDPVKKNAVDPEPAPEKVPIKWHEDKKVDADIVIPDEIPRPGLTIMPADVNVEMYKLHLKDMLFKRIAMASMQEEMVSIYADFGYEVAQELLKVK